MAHLEKEELEQNIQNNENEEIDYNNHDDIENSDEDLNDLLLDDDDDDEKQLDEQDIEEFQEKIRRSGVVYLSYIPEGMTVGFLRKKLEKYAPKRIYLVPGKYICLITLFRRQTKEQIQRRLD